LAEAALGELELESGAAILEYAALANF